MDHYSSWIGVTVTFKVQKSSYIDQQENFIQQLERMNVWQSYLLEPVGVAAYVKYEPSITLI